VEVELVRGGDSRVAIRRPRTAHGSRTSRGERGDPSGTAETVLVGLEPDDPAAATTAADALDHAAALGQRAAKLSMMDPLVSRQAAIVGLRQVRSVARVVLDDQRLLWLAVAASGGEAALSPQGQLYRVGMAADRALRLAASALAGKCFTRRRCGPGSRLSSPRPSHAGTAGARPDAGCQQDSADVGQQPGGLRPALLAGVEDLDPAARHGQPAGRGHRTIRCGH
jgi:hypothetical protein